MDAHRGYIFEGVDDDFFPDADDIGFRIVEIPGNIVQVGQVDQLVGGFVGSGKVDRTDAAAIAGNRSTRRPRRLRTG